ncbi:histidine phosphatase family protein [Patescibacteria group bacterium]|nr:histidine phosphatase family protein [Patescibacteria group bacterium]
MKLILVRHGEKDLNGLLTEKGKVQAQKVGNFLADQKITAVYCSTVGRCEQTLTEIIKNREDDLDIRFSRLIALKTKSEEYSELNQRVSRFVEDLYLEHGEEDTVVVISHNLVIRMFVYYLTKEEAVIDEASVTIFDISKKEAKKVVVNETKHLK